MNTAPNTESRIHIIESRVFHGHAVCFLDADLPMIPFTHYKIDGELRVADVATPMGGSCISFVSDDVDYAGKTVEFVSVA